MKKKILDGVGFVLFALLFWTIMLPPAMKAWDHDMDQREKAGQKASQKMEKVCWNNSFIKEGVGGDDILVNSCGEEVGIYNGETGYIDEEYKNDLLRPEVPFISNETLDRNNPHKELIRGSFGADCKKIMVNEVGSKEIRKVDHFKKKTMTWYETVGPEMDGKTLSFWCESKDGLTSDRVNIVVRSKKEVSQPKTPAKKGGGKAAEKKHSSVPTATPKVGKCRYPAPIVKGVDTAITEIAWEEGGCNEKRFLMMFRESTFNLFAVGPDGKAIGLCQVHSDFNPKEYSKIKADPSVQNQVRICTELDQKGTRFYGADKPLNADDLKVITFPGRPWSRKA